MHGAWVNITATRCMLGPLRTTRNILFLGWFGPIRAAALYYSTFSAQRTGIGELWTAGSLVIVASVVAHGITDTPLTLLYGRRAGSTAQAPPGEGGETARDGRDTGKGA